MFSEILEPRRLTAVDVHVNGYGLFVTGTAESESIEVRFDLAKDAKRRPFVRAVLVLVDGRVVDRQAAINASKIFVDAGGGRDTVVGPAFVTDRYYDRRSDAVYRGLAVPTMTVDGGSGNDRITGGSGDDALYGNGGDDVIVDTAGHDLLDGGDGHDRLDARDRVGGKPLSPGRAGGVSRDTLVCGDGDDRASVDANDRGTGGFLDRVRVGTGRFGRPGVGAAGVVLTPYAVAMPTTGAVTVINTGGLTESAGTLVLNGPGGIVRGGPAITIATPDDGPAPR